MAKTYCAVEDVEGSRGELTEIRHRIHQNPELSHKEVETSRLVANAHALMESIVKAKPAAAKGRYLRTVTMSSTMGPGVDIDASHVDELIKH